MPEPDPWGRPFSMDYYPERALVANDDVAGPFRFVLDGIQGDADFVAAMFELKSALPQSFGIC